MTNIGTLGYYNSIINQAIGKAKGDTGIAAGSFAETAFDSSLPDIGSENAGQTAPTETNGVPDIWTGKQLYKWDEETLEGYTVNEEALAKVRKRLQEEGTNPDARVPTHEITDEQMEWLASRHDFDSVGLKIYTNAEFGNFMLDLAYLNVFSLDEVKHFFGVMPFNVNHRGYLYKNDTGDGLTGYVNPFGGVGNYLSEEELRTGLIMEYLKAKYSGYTEEEYERMTEEFKAQTHERLSIIEDFFDRIAAKNDNAMESIPPTIVNISDKLREDFGVLR